MTRPLTHHLARTLVTGAALWALACGAQAANQVVLSPGASTLQPGQTIELTLSGADFDSLTLGGGVSLQWNPAVLDLVSVNVDAANWEFARSGGLLDAASGTLSELYFASFNGRSGSFNIASLRFVADGPGVSDVTLSGAPAFPFSDEMGEVMAIDFSGARLTVSAVPEPASALLLLAGLCGLARRRTGRTGR